jgi:Domain of unknown function (DUF4338)
MRSAHSDEGLEFKDRAFSVAELQLVQEIVADHGRLSRQELANTVCELLDWRRPRGGLKTWEAKELLAVLDARGLLRLPALRTTKPRGAHTAIPRTERGEPGEPLVARLDELTPVTFRPVSRPEDRRLWRELVERYHPRGHRVPFGAHLRWLVEVARPRPSVVACVQLSSPAWRLAARDRWIGWDDPTRRHRLQHIVNQSRFLVLPWIQVPHLASHLLGQLARLTPGVWHAAYGVRPVLLETLVEVGRPGTCYRAANWLALGPTAGRGRMDRHHRREGLAPKQIFVYPLIAHARELLRGER